MKNALVTGATGFIGAVLCRRMVHEGWNVRGAVRTLSDRERLPPGVEAVVVDCIAPDTLRAPSLTNVDIVIHLAARTHVTREVAGDPLAAYRAMNVAGTERLARAAALAGVRRFVYLSSVKVNGEGKAVSYTASDPPAPEDAYGTTKWEAEQVLRGIAYETGMELVIIRPPLVYGPGVKANFLELIKTIQRGVPLPFAQVRNRRSFIYNENLVDAILACCLRPEATDKTYLVSDGEEVSTPELIRRIASALGRPARLVPFPGSLLRLAGVFTGKTAAMDRLLGSLVVDSSAIRRELGWTPPFTMAEGLKKTADWFKNSIK